MASTEDKQEVTIFRPQKGFQEDFLRSTADIVIGGGAAGGGKLQPYDAPILTPDGWDIMGNIKVGSKIMCPITGLPKNVDAVYPQKDLKIYKLHFSDNTTVECCNEHLWKVQTKKQVSTGNYSIISVDDMLKKGVKAKNGDNNFSIDCNVPVEFNKQDVELEPYLLGVLLGDGYLSDKVSTQVDVKVATDESESFFNFIKSYIPSNVKIALRKEYESKCRGVAFTKEIKDYLRDLDLLGKKSRNKFIPKKYIYNTIETRKDILAGLLDTDGYIQIIGNKRKISYSTMSMQLANGVVEIVKSLGGIATISDADKREKYKGGVSYKVSIRVPFNPFKRDRKAILFDKVKQHFHFKKKITKIEYSRNTDGQCIYVNSKDHLYITEGYNATHNTFAILMDALYDIENPKFGYTYFRRNLTQIKKQGGLWDASLALYSGIKPSPNAKVSELKWEFPSGANISFNHLEYEKDVHSWQGTELPAIGFDELTHFSFSMFRYLLSRNRSTSGIRPRVRATTNPDPDSWVAKFIDWWIDEDGFPIPERSGVLRYFLADGDGVDDLIWGSTKKEVFNKGAHVLSRITKNTDEDSPVNPYDMIKSVTFIPGSIYENKALLNVDPGYLGNLASQDEVTRSHLLEGNWRIKQTGHELVDEEVLLRIVRRSPQTNGRMAITADIALKGKDKMVIFVWNGFHIVDFNVLLKNDGMQAVDAIKSMMTKWHVQSRNVIYDANNIGGYISGFLKGSREFFNNGSPKNGEYYNSLKSQCADKWAMRLNGDMFGENPNDKLNYSMDQKIANRKIGGKPLIEYLSEERRAIRLSNGSEDGKTAIIKKSEMKSIIGHSPDFVETMLMIEDLYLDAETYRGTIIW